jgi:uncharacterized protein (DUF2141 family)
MQSRKHWLHVLTLCVLPFSAQASAASLDIQVTHLRPTRTVTVRVFKDEESWARGVAPVSVQEFKAVQPSQTLHIDGLPPGRYAVRVDQEPNSSSLEMPNFSLDRHGFSGNGSAGRRPSFDRAAVDVGADGARLPVHLFVSDR